MPGLLRDRYFEYAPNRAWDLVTGETVSAQIEEGQPHASDPASGPLIELLDHGVDGMPRWHEQLLQQVMVVRLTLAVVKA